MIFIIFNFIKRNYLKFWIKFILELFSDFSLKNISILITKLNILKN